MVAAACRDHLTDAEMAAFEEVREAAIGPFEQARAAAEPACWSWKLPTSPAPTGELGIWQFLLDWHQDRCAVCGRVGPLDEDHEHDAELIRGWLCPSCNVTEGQSTAPVFERYRDRPPAAILAVTLPYHSNIWIRTHRRPSVLALGDPTLLIHDRSRPV